MDAIWTHVVNNFEEQVLPRLPFHSRLVDMLHKQLKSGTMSETQNIMLYGAPGFPTDLLWETVFVHKFGAVGTAYRRNTVSWHNKVTYIETPYFFEMDMSDPQNPKDLDIVSSFLKDLVQHPCVHSGRHIIILKNIDKLCARRSSFAFRVLLERFANNALFICTTNHFNSIEPPLISRCCCFRVPLATTAELAAVFGGLGLTFHPMLAKHECRDFYFALYVHWLHVTLPAVVTDDFCKYTTLSLHELLQNKKSATIEDVRAFTSKISVHDASFASIAEDILHHISGNARKAEFIHHAAQIDSHCSTTEGHRKPLYIELLLNIAIFGSSPKLIA